MYARLHIKISLPCVKILCVYIKKILRKKEERERDILPEKNIACSSKVWPTDKLYRSKVHFLLCSNETIG